jgi:hypothetical protein
MRRLALINAPKFHHYAIFCSLSCFAFIVWCGVYALWALEYDREYPAVIIFEHEFFTRDNGGAIHQVRAGQAVNYRKAFCVSLDDPQQLVDELKTGERGFFKAGDAILEEQTGFFGQIYGVTRGQYIDGVALPVPDRTFEVQPGCYDITQQVVIPKTLSPGNYYLSIRYTYFRNTLQKAAGRGVTRKAKNISFEVVE